MEKNKGETIVRDSGTRGLNSGSIVVSQKKMLIIQKSLSSRISTLFRNLKANTVTNKTGKRKCGKE